MRPRGPSASNLGHAEIEGSEPSPGIKMHTAFSGSYAYRVEPISQRVTGEVCAYRTFIVLQSAVSSFPAQFLNQLML